MPHPLVNQLRFTRTEFKRALLGLTDLEARQRFLPLNCISWNVGHLAWQEQRYFLVYAQGRILYPDIDSLFAYKAPASTPPLDEMLAAWTAITAAADPWLETLEFKETAGAGLPRRPSFGLHLRIAAPASDLSLLVPHRRKHGHPPEPGACRPARIRRRS